MWIRYLFLDPTIEVLTTAASMYFVFLSKTHNPQCNRQSCEMSTNLEHPREVCLFCAMSFSNEEIAHRKHRIFYLTS